LDYSKKNEYSQSPALSQPQNFPELQTIVQLGDAEPKKHVTVNARPVSYSFEQIKDEIGKKTILKGTIEDHSARMPLRSHRIFSVLERDRVYSFSHAYVHEFPDSSVSLVLTENSRIKEVEVSQEEKLRYVWKARIGNLKRPNWNVVLSGFVTRINSTSGLVRRCNTCKQIIYDACPNNCSTGSISCIMSEGRKQVGRSNLKDDTLQMQFMWLDTRFSDHVCKTQKGKVSSK
jgi:hypothetical protein